MYTFFFFFFLCRYLQLCLRSLWGYSTVRAASRTCSASHSSTESPRMPRASTPGYTHTHTQATFGPKPLKTGATENGKVMKRVLLRSCSGNPLTRRVATLKENQKPHQKCQSVTLVPIHRAPSAHEQTFTYTCMRCILNQIFVCHK